MKKLTIFAIFLCILVGVKAQDAGFLDPSYGTDGISVIPFLYANSVNDIDILSDNKIVSGGSYYSTVDNLLAFKFNTNGSLAGFNAATWYEHYFHDNENILATKVLPDDKILLAGFYGSAHIQYFLIQLTSDGYPDPDFGVDGIIQSPSDFIPQSIDIHYGMSGDYDIFLAGGAPDLGHATIMKFNKDGSREYSFGDNAMYIFDTYAGSYMDIYVSSVGGEGNIYACGYEFTGNSLFITKHDLNTGELISTFADGGCFSSTAPNGNKAIANALVFNGNISNSTITAFGSYLHTDLDMDPFAVRLNTSDGSLDNSFSSDGWSLIRLIATNEYINDAIPQDDGKYYFGGNYNPAASENFFIGRFLADGSLDNTFRVTGLVSTHINGDDIVHGLALNAEQDRLYAGGVCNEENSNRAATIACYYTDFSVGISDTDTDKLTISVYPNPAEDNLTINGIAEDVYLLEIHSVNGMLVHSSMQKGKILNIKIANLKSGMYFLRMSNTNTLQTIKFIKK